MDTVDTAHTSTAARYHVLLIGIDDYQITPLHGCVNDIDAIQRLLLGDRVRLTPDRICRLASPRAHTPHDTDVAAVPATLAHLRAALAWLGSEAVRPGDHVVIYYAGHGTRVAVLGEDGRTTHHTALVPVDGFRDPGDPKLLFTDELDAALSVIAARTRNVTVILDCCYSAGALRPGIEQPAERARFIAPPASWPAMPPRAAAPAAPTAGAPPVAGDSCEPGRADCHVVSACLAHQRAFETRERGVSHGLLTRALIHALHAVPDDLRTVSWRQIWQAMRAEVEERHPWQHLRMAGNPARGVLGGPPLAGNPGLSVIRTHAAYHVAAGTLAGITPGAVLAIYGDAPRPFPRLDSADDHAARIGGLLRVTAAERATAVAEPVEPGTGFALPAGARGRMVAAGAPERLRCALVPDHAELAAELAGSPLLEVVEPSRAQVQLVLTGGRWFLTDDVHGVHADEPILIAFGPHDLGRARRVLEHYYAYAQPLRMAARATDLPGGLELAVLACPSGSVPAGAAQATWPELTSRAPATYALAPDARLCVRARNTSRERLRVTLVCAAASGKVQLLGDQVIDGLTSYVFWQDNQDGASFNFPLPPGKQRCIDRLVAIGSTALAKDLGHLRLEQTFDQILHPIRARDSHSTPYKSTPPPERWTAAQLLLDTRAT